MVGRAFLGSLSFVSLSINSAPPLPHADDFHKIVARHEYMKICSRGVVNGLFAGVVIALSPVLHGASEELRRRVVPDVVTGNNWCCLAITEPETGSDTANVTTTARLTDDGKHYIVNGTKKWITNAIWAKYFITAVRTGGPGAAGVSMLLIERPEAGTEKENGTVRTTKMKLQGGWASGTTFVSFEDVKVPVGNILGQLNNGFKLLMCGLESRWTNIVRSTEPIRLPQTTSTSSASSTFARVCSLLVRLMKTRSNTPTSARLSANSLSNTP